MSFPSYAFGRERPFGESAGFPAGLFSRSLPCLGAGGNPIDLETLNGTSRRRDFPGLPRCPFHPDDGEMFPKPIRPQRY